jgi:hypothetical protein
MTTTKINYIMTIQLNKKNKICLDYRSIIVFRAGTFCHLVYHVSFIRSDAFSPIIICQGNKSKRKKEINSHFTKHIIHGGVLVYYRGSVRVAAGHEWHDGCVGHTQVSDSSYS